MVLLFFSVRRPVQYTERYYYIQKHVNKFIKNHKLRPSNHKQYYQLAKRFDITKQCAYLAVKRYANDQEGLLRVSSPGYKTDVEDGDCTMFGDMTPKMEKFIIDLEEDIFWDVKKNELKTLNAFNGQLVNLIFQEIQKPCAWGFGRVHKCKGEININAICLQALCDSCISIVTENERKQLVVYLSDYKKTTPHSKTRYTTSDSEKSK